MKKLFLLILVGLFLSGCGTAVQRSEFWEHDTHYRSWEHTAYSWSGYKNPSDVTAKFSQEQGWWGIPTPE